MKKLPISPLAQISIDLSPSISFASQVQEAASQGLKFVGVIPQFHCLANSTQDAGDSGKERGRCQVENPGTPDGPPIDTDGNPEPKRDAGGETPCIQQSSGPSKEGGGEGMSKTLDGPNHDQSEVLEEPILGSKYINVVVFEEVELEMLLSGSPVYFLSVVMTSEESRPCRIDLQWL